MAKRLFIGIPMPGNKENPVMAFINGQNEHPGIRWVPECNQHITLVFLGDVDEYQIPKIIEKTEHVASQTQPFTLQFSQFAVAPKRNPYMIWAQFDRLADFDQLCSKLIKELSVNIDHTPLAHITLARFKNGYPHHELNLNQAVKFEIPVTHFCLYESKLQVHGAEYHVIKEFIIA